VLIAPSPDPSAYAREFAKVLGFGDRVRSGLIRRLERRSGRPMTDYDAVSRARAAAEALRESGDDHERGAPPLLVVHDHEDRKIPYRLGEAIASAWQGAELCSTSGLGHQRILSDPGVISTVTQFLGVHAAVGRAGSASKSDAA
jgi:pimeloyl-ACP methyl ester carboxylesterase